MISVIVPIYNVSDFLWPCLESLRKQTYTNFEVIFVDDCSTDSSIQVLEEFLSGVGDDLKYKRVCHQKNRGLGAARNSGISCAQGDFLFFLDSDDVLAHDALEKLIKEQELHNADVVIGSVGLIDCNGDVIDKVEHRSRFLNIDKDRKYLLGGTFVSAWGKLYKREYFLSVIESYPEGCAYEDCIPYLKMVLSSKWAKIRETDGIAVYWRVREGSLSRSHVRIKDLKKYLEFYKEKLPPKDFLLFLRFMRFRN